MYCTSSDVKPTVPPKLVKLIDPKADGGQLQEEFVDAQIVMVSAFINSALGTQYTVPITGEQSLLVLKGICIPLVREAIYGFASEKEIPEHIKATAEYARAELARYSDVPEGKTKPTKSLPDATNRFAIAFDDSGLDTMGNDSFL
jgi:phage gp36-like protein